MPKPKKYKKYTAMSVYLPVKLELAAANGNRQFGICLTARSKKEVRDILHKETGWNFTLRTLNEFNGLLVNETYSFTPPTNGEVYFQNENTGTPHFREWLKFNEWKRT